MMMSSSNHLECDIISCYLSYVMTEGFACAYPSLFADQLGSKNVQFIRVLAKHKNLSLQPLILLNLKF